MNCQNRIIYTVQDGDSLYRLSRHYHTTVTELIMGNPSVNPYNLRVGMQLVICPGDSYMGPEINGDNPLPTPGRPNEPATPGGPNPLPTPSIPSRPNQPSRPSEPATPGESVDTVQDLMQEMRIAWLELIFWNRMYLMSVDAGSKDQQVIEERALQAADEVTDVFAKHLPINVTRQLRNLLTEHVELTGQLIRTLKSGDMRGYDNLIKEWYANVNQIASLLGNQNPYFGGRELRNMLLNYLDMTRETIEHQINGEYAQSIDAFRDMQAQVMEFADFLARGLLAR